MAGESLSAGANASLSRRADRRRTGYLISAEPFTFFRHMEHNFTPHALKPFDHVGRSAGRWHHAPTPSASPLLPRAAAGGAS